MNLIINVNEELYSIRQDANPDKKLKAAVDEAMYHISLQLKDNKEREKKGLAPLPLAASIKDEYNKEIVSIKEAKSLQEIRVNYNKKMEKLPYEKREENLLAAMGEIANSSKTKNEFCQELRDQMNQAFFVTDVKLTPGLERILDYFGNINGIFNTINFKEDITVKSIKELIDLPNPDTGKPPKSFGQLLSNIISMNEILAENERKNDYIDIARGYINVTYKRVIPQEYREAFSSKENFESFLNKLSEINKKNKQVEKNPIKIGRNSNENHLATRDPDVTEKNFKEKFKMYSVMPQFENKPLDLFKHLYYQVPEDKREKLNRWLGEQGINGGDRESIIKITSKWIEEKVSEQKRFVSMNDNVGKNKDRNIYTRGE